jgi:hypothetical protein
MRAAMFSHIAEVPMIPGRPDPVTRLLYQPPVKRVIVLAFSVQVGTPDLTLDRGGKVPCYPD